MKTSHTVLYQNANDLRCLSDNSVDLVVTSPPYPMVAMWDEIFSGQNSDIKRALINNDAIHAFELMHRELDSVWNEVFRVLKDGGITCINIGDATRSMNNEFCLFNSHSRILQHCLKIGFKTLPAILWKKQTNAPNKFMGSGMLPVGAYVTLEHEHILILRKGKKREFITLFDKKNRQESAFFWEERNVWFSDLWTDLKGIKQTLNHDAVRIRSGAYPFELAYRLINMFSVKGDVVLDPFAGTGTTLMAAIASERNSLGVEIDKMFSSLITERILGCKKETNEYVRKRIQRHLDFVSKRRMPLKYTNVKNGFSVVTNQEKEIVLEFVAKIEKVSENTFEASYEHGKTLKTIIGEPLEISTAFV